MRWKEIIEVRDSSGAWGNDSDDLRTADHRQSAKQLGLDDRYSGSDIYDLAKPEQTRHVVDNPIPKNPYVSFQQGRNIASALLASETAVQKYVKVSQLYSTQDYIHPSQVRAYQEYPRGRPLVTELNGYLTILDGNHRVLAAIKNKQDAIEIDFLKNSG